MSGHASPTALIVGASRGLGLAVARELGRQGHRVVITARSRAELDRAVELLNADNINADTRVHDVRDAAGATNLINDVESTHGPVETLIVVAGILKVGPLPDDPAEYTDPLQTMLGGPINVVHAILPAMRRRARGRIGVVASIGGVIPTPHLVPYTTAKFGAVGFSRGLTQELQGTGISVSTIIPGLMRTGGHWNATYNGQAGREYAWFALMSSLPVISADLTRAARIIVNGVTNGKTTIVFTPLARVGARLYGLAPDLTTHILGLLGRMLLPPRGTEKLAGPQAAARINSVTFEKITTLGRHAVQQWNQLTSQQAGNDAQSKS